MITCAEASELNKKVPYEREIILKKKINNKLHEFYDKESTLFYKLCIWIINDWGGIKAAKNEEAIVFIKQFLNFNKSAYKRFASSSKVGSYMFPEKCIIYDSRVAYSLNWILLFKNAGTHFSLYQWKEIQI